jgi:hypothetical protein
MNSDMNSEKILANKVISRYKNTNFRYFYNGITEDIQKFLNSNLESDKKIHVLEQLYFLDLYKNAYLGMDGRGIMGFFLSSFQILKATNDEEYNKYVKNLEASVRVLENLEKNPLNQVKKEIQDISKVSNGVRF